MALALRPAPARAGDVEECLQPLDVVLIIDRSGSMLTEQSGNTRIEWAQLAATGFVTDLNNNGGVGTGGLHRVAVTSYGGDAGTLGAATTELALSDAGNVTAVNNAINGVTANSGANTPLEDGINEGTAQAPSFRPSVDGVPVHHVQIVLSDGRPWPAGNATDPRLPNDTPIDNFIASADETFGIAIGEGGTGAFNPDLDLMHDLSNPDPDNFRHILDAGDLPDLFADLAEDLLCGDIQIEKTPDPAGPVEPGTEVTYTYAVTNSGETPLINVVVHDDKCPPPSGGDLALQSGDTNGNDQLEPGETWNYSCSMKLEETTTNMACADGDFIGGGHDSDCKEVTVVVEEPPPPDEPSITIEKGHNPLGELFAGGPVTYTYDVTNNGNVDLTNVDLEDHLDGTATPACTSFTGPGASDVGDDGILSVDETWHFECTTNVTTPGTTTNEACVGADVVQIDLLQVEQEHDVSDCDTDEVNVPEGSQAGQTGTPAQSVPDTAASLPGFGGPLATLVFGLILVASLGTLAYANVRAARERR
jgi:uncharacterized repeat protein (TIGR01451 family)